MERRHYFSALVVAAGAMAGACDAGSPDAAGGDAGAEMQETTEADGYPDLEMDAGGGSVTDSTGGGYMDAATGTADGGSGR